MRDTLSLTVHYPSSVRVKLVAQKVRSVLKLPRHSLQMISLIKRKDASDDSSKKKDNDVFSRVRPSLRCGTVLKHTRVAKCQMP